MDLPLDHRVDNFASRLLALIGEESVRGFARRCGFSEGVVRSYLRGDTYPTLDRLAVLAAVGGRSIEWLAVGGERVVSEETSLYSVAHYETAGDGDVQIGVDLEWAAQLAETPDLLVSQVVADDAMQPLLKEGDLVIVDISRKGDEAGVYLFLLDERWVPRRVEPLLNGSIQVSGDNPAFSEQVLSVEEFAGLKVLGRVVWAGGVV